MAKIYKYSVRVAFLTILQRSAVMSFTSIIMQCFITFEALQGRSRWCSL